MTNRLAIILLAIICGALVLDLALFGWGLPELAMKGVSAGVKTLAVWR